MKKKYILYIGIVLLIVILFSFVLFLPSKKIKIKTSDIKKMEVENKTGLVYVFSSKKEDCSNCTKMRSYLDKSKLNYFVYDTSEVGEEDYLEFLRYMHIDKKTFHLPALIYIKNGQKQNYLMNIKNEDMVKEYIRDYELNRIKK